MKKVMKKKQQRIVKRKEKYIKSGKEKEKEIWRKTLNVIQGERERKKAKRNLDMKTKRRKRWVTQWGKEIIV
jgi:hypothetical protein